MSAPSTGGGSFLAGPGEPGLVSIVTPFLNVAPYIEETIASVRAQTYPRWELLLVDDGSTDGSDDIARRAAAEDPARIRCLHHPGRATRGASVSRNLAFAHARGELVAFVDADDVWLPGKLEEQVALLRERPEAGVLYGNTRFWYGWTGRPEDAARDYLPPLGVANGTLVGPPALLVRLLEGEAAVPCTCSIVIRRDALRRSGGFEETFQRIFTDQAFYAKLFLRTPVFVVDRVWDLYRQHEASSVATIDRAGEMRARRLDYLEWLRGHLEAERVTDRAVWRAWRWAHWSTRNPTLGRLVKRPRRRLRRLVSRLRAR